MPILVPGTSVSDVELARMIREHREGIQGIVELAKSPEVAIDPPLSLLTISDLGRDLLALCDLALVPEATRATREIAVDASYDGMLALMDLIKSHSELPKVPRSRTARS
jgi:hypothetical protein